MEQGGDPRELLVPKEVLQDALLHAEFMDKLVDEIAKGKAMAKVLRG